MTPEDITKELRKLRRSKELTQKQLAAKVGVTMQTILNLETNRNFGIKTVELVADYFDYDLDISISKRQYEIPEVIKVRNRKEA